MLILKIALFIVGLMFLLFGYFIYFKKKYDLINGFEADFQAGRKDERYAQRVGLIEFIVGICVLVLALALTILV